MWEIFAVIGVFIVWIVVKDKMIIEERRAWGDERRELLTRIQHPEVVQLAPVERHVEIPEPDEIGLVGSVIED